MYISNREKRGPGGAPPWPPEASPPSPSPPLSRLAALLLGASALTWSFAATAQESGDYSVDNPRWNGLSELVALAEARGHGLRPGNGLDLSQLTPQDRLILIYPSQEVDRKAIARFVVDGGKVLLADDFGASVELLDRLGIQRVPVEGVKHTERYLGRPGLPLFRPKGRHRLLEGVEEVVANHPAALTTRGGAVLPYEEDGIGLVYDMRLARGKVIVVGDSSLFINHMLGVADNRRFAANALSYLCDDVPNCHPYLLVGDFALTGSYKPEHSEDEAPEDALSSMLDALNESLQSFKDYTPPHNAIYYASLLLMGGLLVFLVTVLPLRRSPRVVPRIGPPASLRPLSEFEWNLQRFRRAGPQGNYALPVTLLKARFEREFYARVAHGERIPALDDPLRPAFLRQMAQRYVDLHLASASQAERVRVTRSTLRLLEMFSTLPPRHRLFLDSDATFTERDLTRIAAQCRAILKQLGVEEDDDSRISPRERDRASAA